MAAAPRARPGAPPSLAGAAWTASASNRNVATSGGTAPAARALRSASAAAAALSVRATRREIIRCWFGCPPSAADTPCCCGGAAAAWLAPCARAGCACVCARWYGAAPPLPAGMWWRGTMIEDALMPSLPAPRGASTEGGMTWTRPGPPPGVVVPPPRLTWLRYTSTVARSTATSSPLPGTWVTRPGTNWSHATKRLTRTRRLCCGGPARE